MVILISLTVLARISALILISLTVLARISALILSSLTAQIRITKCISKAVILLVIRPPVWLWGGSAGTGCWTVTVRKRAVVGSDGRRLIRWLLVRRVGLVELVVLWCVVATC